MTSPVFATRLMKSSCWAAAARISQCEMVNMAAWRCSFDSKTISYTVFCFYSYLLLYWDDSFAQFSLDHRRYLRSTTGCTQGCRKLGLDKNLSVWEQICSFIGWRSFHWTFKWHPPKHIRAVCRMFRKTGFTCHLIHCRQQWVFQWVTHIFIWNHDKSALTLPPF